MRARSQSLAPSSTWSRPASPLDASAVGASLLAFVVVYFLVFGFGTWYILKLMAKGVQVDEPAPNEDDGPIRTAGITPGPAMKIAEGDAP